MAYLGIEYTITISHTMCLAILSISYIYPDCKGSSRRQAVAPALVVLGMIVFFVKILQPTILGEDLLTMGVCPFHFRLAFSGALLLQFVLVAVLQIAVIRRRSTRA